jgi:hypothetical protein
LRLAADFLAGCNQGRGLVGSGVWEGLELPRGAELLGGPCNGNSIRLPHGECVRGKLKKLAAAQ